MAGATTTRYIFSGTKVIAEYVNGAAVGSPTKEYIYSGSGLLATIEGGTTTYHHQDHLSVRVNTNTSGAVVGEQGHYPFGESWYASSTTTKWQFTSYERDSESALDYAVFRYHGSRLGRFLTPDPIAGRITDPQSLNRYAYVRNDPVNLTDPRGLDVFWCHAPGSFSCVVHARASGGGRAGSAYFRYLYRLYGFNLRYLPGFGAQYEAFFGVARHLSIITTGWDPALGRFRGDTTGQQPIDDPAERARQEACANELVIRLFEKEIFRDSPGLAFLLPPKIDVDPDNKITFTATLNQPVPITGRFGRRPGLDIKSAEVIEGVAQLTGDVDAFGFVGDVVSGFGHLFLQIGREFFTGKTEKPCDLLAALN